MRRSRLALAWGRGNDGRTPSPLYGCIGRVTALAFSPDSKRVAGLTYNPWRKRSYLCLWETQDQTLLWQVEVSDLPARTLAYARDTLATGADDGGVKLWAVKDGSLLAACEGHSTPVLAAAFKGNGVELVTTGRDHTARVWNRGSGDLLAEEVTRGASSFATTGRAVAFAPDDARLAVGCEDGSVQLWDPRKYTLAGALEKHRSVRFLRFTAPDRLVSWGTEGTLRLWADRQGKFELDRTLQAHADFVRVSSGGEVFVTARSDPKDGSTSDLGIWDMTDGSLLATLRDDLGRVTALALSSDGMSMALGKGEGPPLLVSLETEAKT